MWIPSDVLPEKESDRMRWREQALRYRLLTGKHRDDVVAAIEDQFAQEIAADLEISPDLSRNPFILIWNQLNVAYLEPPEVRVLDGGYDEDLSSIVTPRLFAQQNQTSLFALAMGESLVRIDWKHWADAKEASYRIVQPDHVVVESLPDEPDQPGRVEELRYREDVWTWEIWDIRGEVPIFKIEEINDEGERVDATEKWAPEFAAKGAYPYRNRAGDPLLPYVLFHKQIGSRLWNWTSGSELTNGALKLSAYWTHWGDGFLNAAHPQRWILDVDSQAGITRTINGTAVDVIPADRKSILKFSSKGPGGGSLGQFSAAMDPLAAAEALRLYEQGLAVYAGLSPSDLQVTQGQSGYSIIVSRAGQIKAQKAVEPSFRIADQKLLATAAALSNFYMNTNLPEDPRSYGVYYRSLKPTLEERKAEAQAIKAEVELGLISSLDALRRLHPEIESDEEALERLLRVREIERTLQNMEELPNQQQDPSEG
mgnify:CR=1 FL=1